MKPPVKPILLSPAAMKALVGKLTRSVLADPKIQAYLAKEEAARKAALPAGSVGKSAPRPPAVDARTAASLRKLDARLTAFEERFRAGRQAAYTARVDGIVEKVAEARAIAKTAPRVLAEAGAQSFKELRQLRREVGETAGKLARVAETLTKNNGTRDARPRRIQ